MNLEDKAVFALIYFYLHIKPYETGSCAGTQKEHFLFPPLIDVQTGGGGFSFVKSLFSSNKEHFIGQKRT